METILILHGWGSSAKKWQSVKDGLENGGCKIYLRDLPGFGENLPLDKPWFTNDYVNWVKELCDKQNIQRFILIGHSFGGNIAAQYAIRFPHDVAKLILVDPAVVRVKDIKKEILARIAQIIKKISFLPFYHLFRRAFYKFIVKSDYPDTEGPMRETYLNVVKQDFSNQLSKISVPTLLIWGEKDNITPFKYAKIIQEKIAGSKLEGLPDMHHSPQIEAPELLVKKILDNL